jgi:hypothetical protein
MKRVVTLSAISALILALGNLTAMASGSFICKEPGGKRLIQIDDKEISKPGGKMLIYIDGNDLLLGDIHANPFLVVDDDDVRPSAAGVIIAHFDGEDIRHGPRSDGKVLINYSHPNLAPSSSENRIYSIEGEQLTKQQLVAGLHLLHPDMFKLSAEETAAQQAAMREAGAEADRLAAADQIAGKWEMLNGHGPVEKIGSGLITVDTKKGDAYTVSFDHTKDGGPSWTGVGAYKEVFGDKFFWVAYGTPKTIGLCVYEIKDGGVLEGKWYPWYLDGNPVNVGTENLRGPANLDGEYTITSANAPSTGTAYSGTVTIRPLDIVGSAEQAMPYSVSWTLGTYKVEGIGIRSGDFLFVSSGSGPDVNIAKFIIRNGTMTSDWFKLGSDQQGGSAAMTQ